MVKKKTRKRIIGAIIGIVSLLILDFIIFGLILGFGKTTNIPLILGIIAKIQLPFPLSWVVYLGIGALLGLWIYPKFKK